VKIRSHPSKPNQGSTLILAVIFAGIVLALVAVYLLLVEGEFTTNARSEAWNTSLVLAEAGLEEALTMINKNQGSSQALQQWPATVVSEDGWTLVDSNVYFVHRVMDTNIGCYDIYVTNHVSGTNNAPTILSVGSAFWNLPGPAVGENSLAVSYKGPAVRRIFLTTRLDSLLSGALVAADDISFKGNNVTIDSFNSSDPVHSDWQTSFHNLQGNDYGFYPANPAGKRTANADVATNKKIVDVGNAQVYGHLITGPDGTADIGPVGSVGDTNWIGPDPKFPLHYGAQPDYVRNDMNVTFSDVILPTPPGGVWKEATHYSGGVTVAAAGATNKYYYVITNTPGSATNYYTVSSSLTKAILINASNVVLYLPDGLSFNQKSDMLVVNTNASLTLYSGGDINTGGLGTINNATKYALNLGMYGLPTCTHIDLGGNAAATWFIYAPEASLKLNGGGNNNYDVVGAIVCHDITINGHFNFHYDDALKTLGPPRGYIASSWREVAP
jgi:hypothetical protein